MKSKPKILALRSDWNVNKYRNEHDTWGGIGHYRIVKPAESLKEFYDIDIVGKEFKNLNGADGDMEKIMDYIYRTYDLVFTRQIDNNTLVSNLIACAKYFKKPIVMDMDDNFIDIKQDNPAFKEYAPGSQKVMMLQAAMGLVDALTVSTKPLMKLYKRLNPNIHLFPNFNDVNDWPLKAHKLANRRVIGYAGSITHDSDIMLVVEPLKEIFRKYPDVTFEVVGAVGETGPFKEVFGEFRDRVHAYGGSPAWDNYNKVLSEMHWTFAIAPLENDDFTRCKSNIKWMEYTMMGWATVASNVEPYKVIKNNVTGLLCDTPEDWVKNLSLLLDDVALQDRLLYNAKREIEEKYQWKDNTKIYRTVFDKLLTKYKT